MKRFVAFLLILFNANFAFGYITENVTGGCSSATVGSDNLYAVFTINEYTCSAGYYLPANYDGCVACPTGATCPGGTYNFNNSRAQGITYNLPVANNVSRGCNNNLLESGAMVAKFTINTYTCNPGYYVPANHDGCVICPINSYCPGGTYTFNETTAQGITACAAGLYAPTGMWEAAQCGRILHIGNEVLYLRATKITDHALHVDVDHDGFADYFGNMTTADVVMHAGSERKFKIKYGNTIYSVYDDTVTIP